MRQLPRWGRWAVGLVLTMVLVVLAALLVVRLVADSRLEGELERARASGAVLDATELAPDPVPDEENAARIYERVFAHLVDEVEYDERDGATFVLADALHEAQDAIAEDLWVLDGDSAALLERWVEANRAAIDLLPEAVARPDCVFDVDFSRGYAAELPAVAPLQLLGRVLRTKALLETRRGDVDGALATIALGLRASEQALQPPVLIHMLVRTYFQGSMLAGLAQALAAGVPTAEALDDVGASLEGLDHTTVLENVLVWERALGHGHFEDVAAGRQDPVDEAADVVGDLGGSLIGRLPRLVFQLDHARYLGFMRRAIALAERPYHEVRDDWQAFHDEAVPGPWYAILSRMMALPWRRGVVAFWETEARLDLAHLAIEVERCRGEMGRLPMRLEDLGPDAVSRRDPFRDAPYVYRPAPPGGYVLYGAGPDGVDDGGVEEDGDDVVFAVSPRPTPDAQR